MKLERPNHRAAGSPSQGGPPQRPMCCGTAPSHRAMQVAPILVRTAAANGLVVPGLGLRWWDLSGDGANSIAQVGARSPTGLDLHFHTPGAAATDQFLSRGPATQVLTDENISPTRCQHRVKADLPKMARMGRNLPEFAEFARAWPKSPNIGRTRPESVEVAGICTNSVQNWSTSPKLAEFGAKVWPMNSNSNRSQFASPDPGFKLDR